MGASLSVTIPDDVAASLEVEAEKRKMTPDALATEFISARVKPRGHRLSFTGIGESTSGLTARDVEEARAEGLRR